MKQRDEIKILNESIKKLEHKQAYEFDLLKDQFALTIEGFKPATLIKRSLHNIVTSSELKNDLIGNAIGLATGYLSKKVMIGGSHNPIKRLLGTILQFAVSTVVAKKADSFISAESTTQKNKTSTLSN